jgi:hypothetical protein
MKQEYEQLRLEGVGSRTGQGIVGPHTGMQQYEPQQGKEEQKQGHQSVEAEGEACDMGGLAVAGSHHYGKLVFAGREDDENFEIAEKDIAETEIGGSEEAQKHHVGGKGYALGDDTARKEGAGVFDET